MKKSDLKWRLYMCKRESSDSLILCRNGCMSSSSHSDSTSLILPVSPPLNFSFGLRLSAPVPPLCFSHWTHIAELNTSERTFHLEKTPASSTPLSAFRAQRSVHKNPTTTNIILIIVITLLTLLFDSLLKRIIS